MYLISAYFDDNTNNRLTQYINQLAAKTGNTYMTDNHVPPHITLSAFETNRETEAVRLLEKAAERLSVGTLQWVSVGTFFPSVIYLAPVLNVYLQSLSQQIYDSLIQIQDITISRYYQPFSWFPHATMGKKLSMEEMKVAFSVLQHQFGAFFGQVTALGLAKTNPYEDLAVFLLEK